MKSQVLCPKSEVRSRKSEVGSLKLEVGSQKSEDPPWLSSGSVRTTIAKHHGRYSKSDHLCQGGVE